MPVLRGTKAITPASLTLMESDLTDRREWRRHILDWPVHIRAKDPSGSPVEQRGTLENMSVNGAFMKLLAPLEVGLELEVWIGLPLTPRQWMKYSAEVLRTETGQSGQRIAIKFLGSRPTFTSMPEGEMEIV